MQEKMRTFILSCLFITGEWGGFFRHIPPTRHFYGKDLTFPIEATHSAIRHRLGRFHRRSKITSHSREMVEISLNIFHHLQKHWEQFLKTLRHLFGEVSIKINFFINVFFTNIDLNYH